MNRVACAIVFLPGAVMPAATQYEPLLRVLGDRAHPLLHDLEVYAGDAPPPGYDLDVEVESLRQAADAAGWDRVHLVGYSGGGAVCLAFTAAYPERVKSLALSEPAAIPSPQWREQEAGWWAEVQRAMLLPPQEQMREFVRIHLRPDVPPPTPPAGDPPPWMARRPAGIKALVRAFSEAAIPLDRLRRFPGPAYVAVGRLSNAVEERKAETLARLVPDVRVEIYEHRHHFDPPQRAEPERFAAALLDLWARAANGTRASQPGAL